MLFIYNFLLRSSFQIFNHYNRKLTVSSLWKGRERKHNMKGCLISVQMLTVRSSSYRVKRTHTFYKQRVNVSFILWFSFESLSLHSDTIYSTPFDDILSLNTIYVWHMRRYRLKNEFGRRNYGMQLTSFYAICYIFDLANHQCCTVNTLQIVGGRTKTIDIFLK